MAIYEDFVSKARLKVFLDEIKKHFPVSVNGKKPDSNGNVDIDIMTGATASSAGKKGLVPIPKAGQQDMALCGGATYKVLPITGGGTGLTSSPSMLINLGSTSAANVLQKSPRPGVTGILPIDNGGTGANTVAAAVKALLGSSAIGSSTKPLYYDGAALKACADSIGGGGIVAQLLEQNGYVKFANGLILQWGLAEKVPIAINYNIPLNISVNSGLYGDITPCSAPNIAMANNAVISISANTMTVISKQPSPENFWWFAISL